MNVILMRKLDYWAGLPLCFFFSILNFFLKTLTFSRREKKIEKILFIKLSELGAIILAYPLLKRLKADYPSAQLYFLTFEKNKSIFALLGGIIPEENIIAIREDSAWAFASDTLRAIKRLRKEAPDVIFDLEFFSRFTTILAYLAGANKRVGFYKYTFEGLSRGSLLTHKIQYNPLNHISRTYLSLAQVIAEQNKDTPELKQRIEDKEIIFPQYLSKKEVAERVEGKLKGSGINGGMRLFLINPGEGVIPVREWPLGNFIKLAKAILEDNKNCVILIGTDGAGEKGKVLLGNINNPRCISLIGQTTLEELIELFNRADILVSNDCGLAHLAMLTSIKKFIIFGPESPQIFAPLGGNNWIIYSGWPCSPCLSVFNHRLSTCSDNRCLKVIQPDFVHELIKKSLQ